MTGILTAENVRKSFDGKTEVLKGVSLAVNKGDFISILGASGSGKSTLLTILGGMDSASEGRIIFEDRELNTLKEKELAALRRTKVGFVFQFFNLAPYLTVEENIYLPLILDGRNVKNYRAKFEFLIKYLKIEGIVKKMPAELSGGEQQRTAIARALIYEPDIIFLDEPTGNLDSASAEEIMKLLQNVNKELKTTVLQVTHSEKNAAFGNRLIRISDGLITEDSFIEREENNIEERKEDFLIESEVTAIEGRENRQEEEVKELDSVFEEKETVKNAVALEITEDESNAEIDLSKKVKSDIVTESSMSVIDEEIKGSEE